MENAELVKKWEVLIGACKAYYIDNIQTGMSDSQFDQLERDAAIDGFFVRDYVFKKYSKGTRSKNAWVGKIKKSKIQGTMLESMKSLESKDMLSLGKRTNYYSLKYDGSSIAIYIDPNTGKPIRVVTVGNLNIDDCGVDQTWKLMRFLPQQFPKGIVAIQAEGLIDLERCGNVNPDLSRQKANGLVNSTKDEAQLEVSSLLTLRALRYYASNDGSPDSLRIASTDFRQVMQSLPTTRSPIDGRILFTAADVWTFPELSTKPMAGYTETGRTKTSTGTFLNDGWVVYNPSGECIGALKYPNAGNETELPKTKVRSIQWNSQVAKGKDSWSANVIIDPIVIQGCTIRKPSAGSVKKLVTSNITPRAEVGIMLANSTIPMVGEVFSPGNGDFMWPKCPCGYQMSESDIYGSLLKCGNLHCTERLERMEKYLGPLESPENIDLNKLLALDRFKWENTSANPIELVELVRVGNSSGFGEYLGNFLKTELQKKNLELVVPAAFEAIKKKLK